MIIDLRSRIWLSLDMLGKDVASRLRARSASRWESLDGSAESHERGMACAEVAVVHAYRSGIGGGCVPNELVAQFVAKNPSRRVGIAAVDIMNAAARDEVGKAMDLGLSGIAISPACQGFHPAHSSAMRLYEECVKHGLPVFVANDVPLPRGGMLEFARPSSFDEVARSLPDLCLVIGEMGWPWVAETLALLSKHERVYADVACISGRPWDLYNALIAASEAGTLDRILFGSGFPFQTPEQAIESIYSINSYGHGTKLPGVARSELRAIVEADSLAILGIEHESRRSSPDSNQRASARSRGERTGVAASHPESADADAEQ
jgi:predicted TIM-barrel fold metal-dependent hydrolase